MFTESRLLRTIEDIYEAATDCADLDCLAQTLARAFDSESAIVVIDEMPTGNGALPPTVAVPSTTENFDGHARQVYAEYYHGINIWLREALKQPLPLIVLCDELVDERSLERHEWYDFCRLTSVHHCMGTAFAVGDNLMAEIGIHRRRAEAPLVADDKRKMAQLRPHLQRALQLQHRFGVLEHNRAIGLEVLGSLTIGVILVDAKARVLFANEIAERVLRSHRGITSLPALRRLVHECAQTSAGAGAHAGGIVNVARADGSGLLVSVAPLRARAMGFGPSTPAAVLTFCDPQDSIVDGRALADAYGLTPAECRLAAAIADGVTLAEYAERNCITIGTARTHLKHIFQKTGWRRQADLVRALADPILKAY
jgi:DNA-binding CsgD family transcriptional regulator